MESLHTPSSGRFVGPPLPPSASLKGFLTGGWWFSYGSFSAYLMMPDSYRGRFVTPRIVNTFFIGGGIGLCTAHLVRLSHSSASTPRNLALKPYSP